MKFKSVGTKIMITILPLIILAMAILGGLAYYNSKNIINNEIDSKVDYKVNSIIESIEKSLLKHGQIAVNLSETVEASGSVMKKDNYVQLTGKLANSNNETLGTGVWFEPYKYEAKTKFFGPYSYKDNGKVVYTDDYSTPQYNYFQYDWYKGAKNSTKKIVWSEPYVDNVTKITMVTASSPFYDKTKSFMGTTTADIDLTTLQDMVSKIKIGNTGKTILLTKDGTYIAGTTKDKIMKVNITKDSNSSLSSIGKQMVNSKKGNGIYSEGKDKRYIYYAEVPETGWIVATSISQSELFAPVNSLILKMLPIIVILTILIIALIILVSKYIVKSIKNVNVLAQEIASGNLTHSIKVENEDEFGKMALNLNRMNDNLKNVIISVNEGLEQVVATSEELTASAEQTETAAQQIADSMQQVAAGSEKQMNSSSETYTVAEEVLSGVEHISQEIQVAADYSMNAYSKAEGGNDVVGSAINQMKQINEKVLISNEIVNVLGEKSNEIGNIISLIDEVASQTNLLALNAAIEAARAGEHGKGFAVVADEVRKLAEQSSEATGKISLIISEIQYKINDAIKSMGDGKEATKIGIELVESAGQSFKTILQQTDGVSKKMQNISAVSEEILAQVNGMVTSINKISDISKDTSCSTQNIAASSEEQTALMEEVSKASETLADMAVGLQKELNKFKL